VYVPRRSKVVVLAGLAAAGAILPLFGDPRVTPVTHPLWARMLLRSMDMDEAVQTSVHASAVFDTLSGRKSRVFAADGYSRADGLVASGASGRRRLSATEGVGEVTYTVAVVQGGDYLLRARVSGDPARPVSAEIAPMGRAPAVGTFKLVPPREPSWILAGAAHLDPGTYTTSLLLPSGTSLEYVEVAPPCVNPVEPIGGWKPAAITSAEDLAVTALRALDMEDGLAPADTPLEHSGTDFERDDGSTGTPLKADRHGLGATLVIDLPEGGLYTLEAFITPGQGQRWRADGCRKAVLCAGSAEGWRVVMTQSFSGGRHAFSVSLADGAAVERVRLTRRKETAADYVAALRRLGFDPGEGSVPRPIAVAAAQFVGRVRTERQRKACGDVAEPTKPMLDSSPSTVAAGAAAPANPGGAPPTTPLTGALLPPQQASSPILPGPS
jgi:hypothetical protein